MGQQQTGAELIQEDPAAEMLSRLFLILVALGLFSTFFWTELSPFVRNYYSVYVSQQNVSLCACDSCIAEFQPGFSELYNNTPQLFLSPERNISGSIFKYWSSLQPSRASFRSYNETVKKVFQMFPPGPKLTEPSPDRCRTCAVVGNSGNLNGSHYGPLIDFHDIVIRINKAPVKGYERDVGTKTTHHVMYPVSASNLDNNTHLLFFAFKKADLDWLIRAFTPRDKKDKNSSGLQANKDLVMILNPEFIKYVHHVWLKKRGRYPSTGFLTLILSLHMCDEVDVFGFGADEKGNWHHYFEKLKNKRLRTGQHPGNDELEIIKRLAQQKKIRFFRGW